MNTKDLLNSITHASAFFAPFVFPIVVWIVSKDEDVTKVAKQALFFHLGLAVCIGISWLLSFILIGIPFLVVFAIMGVYYPIKGIVYTLTGRSFHYPLMR